MNREWVPVGAPLMQLDAEFLRDLIHKAGFPARAEQIDVDYLEIIEGRGWLVWTPLEHEADALQIRDRNFTGPTRRRRRKFSLTRILRNRRPAA